MKLYTDYSIFWFRQDLRINDNPGLSEALEQKNILPIYIFDTVNTKEFQLGDASKLWLYHSLNSLNKSLDDKLSIYKGNPLDIILNLIEKYPIKSVYWNRCYEPWQITRDTEIKTKLKNQSIATQTFNANLLWEPWTVLKKDQTPYKVFTPFYKRGCLNAPLPRKNLPTPDFNDKLIKDKKYSIEIDKLNLLPKINWDKSIIQNWQIGEKSALDKLNDFFEHTILNYKVGRDFPSQMATSYLSPHLHFGEISPNQIFHKAKEYELNDNIEHFIRELIWREFSYNLLYHFPKLPSENLQTKFNQFPWKNNQHFLKKWQQGKTGYPLVDAGMRELWQTGYMHNRIRMVCASFLVKNLLIDWRLGEAWFWECLFDADLANNSASWQWVAGCGADAAPYFRIFNPITQGHKFDPDGEYTKKYCPELKDLPTKYLFSPWEAPEDILKQSKITLGKNYPLPIIDLKESREKALSAYHEIK